MTVSHVATPHLSEDIVRTFALLGRDDVAYAGGKGANLGELTAAGFPVPEGFVVGAPAYAAFCARTGLRERLVALLDGVDVEDTVALQAASLAARELFDEIPIPEPLAGEIRAAYERLADEDARAPVAVRSSATAEDTADTSFAGMNETFLNIRGADAVVDAVRRCWRSLFGARTIYYRGLNGFGEANMDIAVVVQRQLDSTRAGVMFTVNPATGERRELVIEGSFGLGEAVVSGSVSPDRYIVEKATLAILRREVHHKDLVIEYAREGGTRRRSLSEEDALRPVLNDDEVVSVAQLGRRIEEHYGAPQDTEWAFDPDGALWMLQSRPITTLHHDEPEGVGPPGSQQPETVLLRGLGGAPGERRRRRACAHLARGRAAPEPGRRPGHTHDLARLAAAVASRRGGRHGLRRHDLPRRDRFARAGDPVRRRHRGSDPSPARRGARDGGRRARCRGGGAADEWFRAGISWRAGRGGRRIRDPGTGPRDRDPDPCQPLRAVAG